MWIKSLNITNLRSISAADLQFSRGINLLVGRNNAGKSTILLPLMSLQEGLPFLSKADVRLKCHSSRSTFTFADFEGDQYLKDSPSTLMLEYNANNNAYMIQTDNTPGRGQVPRIKPTEPLNFIYPFFSKRKVTTLRNEVTSDVVERVSPTFENLNAKIDRLNNTDMPAFEMYMRACDQILGFRVTTYSTAQGKEAVYIVDNRNRIPLLAMGEGVMNILGLVVNLAIADRQLFLIEEPENDVHPQALKSLLDLIIEKSSSNQFIITTHSNIVLRRLGALPETKVFRLDQSVIDKLPTTTVTEVPPGASARREILDELGYELADHDLWSGWLFLEEASAEKIIREYLIPEFAPTLQQRLRTYSARSRSEVAKKLRDFNDLFVFLHLEPTYKNKVWVVIDGGDTEAQVINELKEIYGRSGWTENHFRQFSKHDFEEYYPPKFDAEVSEIKSMTDKQKKRITKAALLAKVEQWFETDRPAAVSAFQASAAEVISILKEIEGTL